MSEENNNNNQPTQSPTPQAQPQVVPQKIASDPIILPQANDTGTFIKGVKPKK